MGDTITIGAANTPLLELEVLSVRSITGIALYRDGALLVDAVPTVTSSNGVNRTSSSHSDSTFAGRGRYHFVVKLDVSVPARTSPITIRR